MKAKIILLITAITLQLTAPRLNAQNKKMDISDFEKRKVEYVTKKAGLSKAEAQNYFPLNNELTQKKFELRKNHRDKVQKLKDNSNISDEEYIKLLNNDSEIKIQEANLDQQYTEKFQEILSPEKLYKAQQAEKDFIQNELMNFRSSKIRSDNKANKNKNK